VFINACRVLGWSAHGMFCNLPITVFLEVLGTSYANYLAPRWARQLFLSSDSYTVEKPYITNIGRIGLNFQNFFTMFEIILINVERLAQTCLV